MWRRCDEQYNNRTKRACIHASRLHPEVKTMKSGKKNTTRLSRVFWNNTDLRLGRMKRREEQRLLPLTIKNHPKL